jgi:hypothetical protein
LGFEVFVGRWVDATALSVRRNLRQEDAVTVSWGSSGEQARALAPPSAAEGALNNDGGHWTPGNPMGEFYDWLGRNVPTRLFLRAASDAFGRTLPTSLGPTDTGEAWNTAGVNDTYSVGLGVGNIKVSAAASFGLAFIGDSYADCESRITFDVGAITPTGAAIEPGNPVVRYQGGGALAGEHYLLRVVVLLDQTIWASIQHSSLGNLTAVVNTGLVNAPGRRFRASLYAEGQALRGQVWDVTTPDKPGWIVSAHHDRLSGGLPGFRAGVAAGNTNAKPLALPHDDWELRLYQHVGELTSLVPNWDAGHKIKTAAFKTAGITQRLGRPNTPVLSSAPRRYLAEGKNGDFTATDAWPLDEAANAPMQGLNAVVGGSPVEFRRETGVLPNRGAVKWGETDTSHAAVPAFATLNNGGRLAFSTRQTSLGTAWSVMWAMRLSPDSGGQVFLSTAAVTNRFVFFLYTDGTYELFTNPSGASLATGVLAPNGLDGFWCTLGLTTFNNGGAAVGYHLNVNGVTLGIGSTTGDGAHSPLREVLFHVPQPSTGGQGESGFSSLFVTPTRFDTFTGGKSIGYRAHWALMGWRGENAGLRAFRLAAEEGVPFDYYGNLGTTRAMGPQRPESLLKNLEECADVDGALLFEPRYALGVVYRPRRALCVQVPASILSYSGGHVSGAMMSSDDRPTANYVRAEKINGGFRVVEQASGPMNTKNPDALPLDPDAVGRTPAEAKVNVESEAQLGDVGGWVRALGTVPEPRFPRIAVDLRNRDLTVGPDPTKIAREVVALRPGDRLLVQGMTSADVYQDLDQLVRGGRTMFVDTYQHQVVLNTAPYEKYRSGVYGEATSRYAGPGQVTVIDAQLLAGVVGGRAVTTTAGLPWTTSAAAFVADFYVLIGGELVRLSGITGAGLAAQTMTIAARAVNGVVKTHPAGTRVHLYRPVYYS